MILDTPTAERIAPTANAMIPRIKRSPGAFERPTLDPEIVRKTIANIGGRAEAASFFQDCNMEIEAIVRNRMGKENAKTKKNPFAQGVGFETKTPTIAASGRATKSKNHDRISIPMSLRKFSTFSPCRIATEFSVSPITLGITTPINGKSNVAWRLVPPKGRARTDASTARVRKTETTWRVDGKPTLRMKLNAPTVPPTPVVVFWATTDPLGASHSRYDILDWTGSLLL
jgi:hypothetical protein